MNRHDLTEVDNSCFAGGFALGKEADEKFDMTLPLLFSRRIKKKEVVVVEVICNCIWRDKCSLPLYAPAQSNSISIN